MKNVVVAIAVVIGYIALTVVSIVHVVRHPTDVIGWVFTVAVVGLGVGAVWSAKQTNDLSRTDVQTRALITSAQSVVDKLDAQSLAPQAGRIEPSSDIRQIGVAVGQMVASLQQDGGLSRAEAVQFAATLCKPTGPTHD